MPLLPLQPAVTRAIFAALQAQDWQTALALAARHAPTLQAQGRTELLPQKIAADIVADLMVQLEQVGACDLCYEVTCVYHLQTLI